jgi:hypothetical protein
MSLKSIFNANDTNRVHIPEIEVQGDRLTVQGNESQHQSAGGSDEREQDQKPRTYRLPKTKWFGR